MARRRSGEARKKSAPEARFERYTWAALVALFAFLYLFPDTLGTMTTNLLVPLLAAIILLVSSLVQYGRGWRVSPITPIGGGLCAAITYYVIQVNPAGNYLIAVLVIVIVVIAAGIFLGDS